MIATISKQGGRRYPQMRSGWSAHARLDAVGNGGLSATMTGPWANVLHLYAGQKLALHTGEVLDLQTGKRLELGNE